MTDTDVIIPERLGANTEGLRLRTLVRLRWLAVVGQSATVILVYEFLGFPLPIGHCLALIALSAWVNILLAWRWRGGQQLGARPAALLLGYDIAQLAGLLFLTGGLQNPFAFLFLVPVTVSATTLPLGWTIGIGVFAFLCATVLAFYHLPLPWEPSAPLQLPSTYVAGMWTALASGAVFSAIYARRIAVEARQMSSALSATELVLAREQRLSALDGLAAAAAHELGTPLATIALVAKELKRELPSHESYNEDLDLLISQTARCREILSRLSSREHAADEIFGQVKLTAMIEDLVAPLRGSDVAVRIDARADGQKPSVEPVFLRNPGIIYGLGNLLENAIDFAETDVFVLAHWNATTVTLVVTDDGPGFDDAIFDRLGDPFVTTRPGYDVAADESAETGKRPGMGLGLFIAKTLLERSGASVQLFNRKQPEHGASISIKWPRGSVDVTKNP
jgi:two-component system, sensor histidine kinase RegB